MNVNANNIGEAWLECIRIVMEYGDVFHDGNFPILEALNLSLNIKSPSTKDLIVDGYGDPIVIARMLKKFKEIELIEGRPFSYGQRLFSYNGIDQIDWVINRLKTKQETKSACITLLVPGDNSVHLPCLTTLDFKIRFNKLNLSFFFRSQNILGRQYANLVALADLQFKVAREMNVDVGYLSGLISSAHIYEYDKEIAIHILSGKKTKIKDEYYLKGPGK